MIRRPHAITEGHLQRRALVYIRQSSEEQVRDNIGSTAVQRDLVSRLQDWGWPPKSIELIDDDLGVSGSHPGTREGFKRMIALMKTSQVGAVAVTTDSRLSRNLPDFAEFIEVARRYDVLLIQDNQVMDFRDTNSEFIATILGSLAARENRLRVELSQRARRKKAEAGIAPTAPPVGYIIGPGRQWLKDPDPQVQVAIQLLFDKFFEVGSVRGLVRYLRQHSIQLPRNPRRGGPRWVEATYSYVQHILRHPAYSGVYVYGRRTVDERAERYPSGKPRFRRRPPDEWVVIHNHHEPYVSPERQAEIQRRLTANRNTLIAPVGRGPALVQGLLRCTVHKRAFRTTYRTRHREPDGHVIRRAQYGCLLAPPSDLADWHVSILAQRLDPLIEAEVLATLMPPSLEVIKEAAYDASREYTALERSRQDELRRLQAEVDEAQRAFDQTDKSYSHVRHRLLERLESALRNLSERKTFFQLHPLTPPLALTEAELAELRALLEDLPRLWHHPDVTAEQRKAVIRAVIKGIHVTPGPETWTLEIEWANGARMLHTLLTDAGKQSQMAEAFAFIHRRFAEGAGSRQIKDELNARRLGQQRGRWTISRVTNTLVDLHRCAIPGLPPLPTRRGIAPRIRALHAAGLTRREIVKRLREEGVVTPQHRPVTLQAVSQVLRNGGVVSEARRLREEVERLMRHWADTASPAVIASRLNERGLRTTRDRAWIPSTVRDVLAKLGLRQPQRRLKRTDGRPGS